MSVRADRQGRSSRRISGGRRSFGSIASSIRPPMRCTCSTARAGNSMSSSRPAPKAPSRPSPGALRLHAELRRETTPAEASRLRAPSSQHYAQAFHRTGTGGSHARSGNRRRDFIQRRAGVAGRRDGGVGRRARKHAPRRVRTRARRSDGSGHRPLHAFFLRETHFVSGRPTDIDQSRLAAFRQWLLAHASPG